MRLLWGCKIGDSAWKVEKRQLWWERDVAIRWNLGTAIKIYRCWDYMELRHYSW